MTAATGARSKWWVLVSVGVGTFMSALDGSIVNTLLPVMRDRFGTDLAGIEWVVTVYLLVVSGFLLSFGRLGDLRGHKSVYLAGFVIFILASVACAFAPSEHALVVGRGVQALGAAMLFANSPAILTANFPPEQRGQALGLQATMTYLGLTVGPPLGGWLASALSWRAVFFINVPIGAVALALAVRFIPRDVPQGRSERFDLAGAATFTAGLVALLVALNQGHDWGWRSALVMGLLGAAALLLTAFVALQARVGSPMLDLSLFRDRTFSASVVGALANYIALFHVVFVLPFYLIQGRGLGPAQAGTLLMVQSIAMALSAPLSGTLSDRIGTVLPSTAGMVVLAGGLFILSWLGAHSPLWQVGLGLSVVGLGTGVFISPNNSALLGAAPPSRRGIAAGILAEARNVGMVLGVGLSGAIVSTVMETHDRGPDAPDALFAAVRASLLAAAAIALAGAAVCIVRAKRTAAGS